MKNFIFLVLVLISSLFTSCIAERKYTYIETVRETDIWGKTSLKEEDEKIITTKSDTLAYIEAFTTFCIAQKAYTDMCKKGYGEYLSIPISFKLINDQREDITNIEFATKQKAKEEILAKISAMGDIVGDSGYRELTTKKIDSVKVQKLLPYFNVQKDEFDPNGRVWYTPKSAPKYTNSNGIYMYFAVIGNKVQPLRFRIQYYADDWLFFNKVQFSIDDRAFEFIPLKKETDNSGGMIWEWFDEALTGSDKSLIYALSKASTAKIKFIGRQYYDIKVITPKQIGDINRTLELYNAMGGNY